MERFLPEFVYGSTDGTITTFAIIAGAIGAGLSRTTIIIIGIASILADGYSMGISSYLSESARHDQNTTNQSRSHDHSPILSGVATSISFVGVGILPLLPFLLTSKITDIVKYISLCIALFAFFITGFVRGQITKQSPFLSGIQSLLIGGSASLLSYFTGSFGG